MKLAYLKFLSFRPWVFKSILGLTLIISLHLSSLGQSKKEERSENISYCELFNSPEKYDGKLIRINVILSASIQPATHAMDSTLHHPGCNIKMVTDYGYADQPTSKLGIKLKKLFLNSKKNGYGRAFVILVGRFQTAKKGGFGAFSEFHYKIELSHIESAKEVNKRIPW